MKKYETLALEQENGITSVALNRPDVRNAMNEAVLADLIDAFTSDEVCLARVVVLKGTGKVFCAGADVEWMKRSAKLTYEENISDASNFGEALLTIQQCPAPVICCVHGAAFGGALGLISVSDIVVAADSTKYSFSECRLGIIPAIISSFVVPKIGISKARHLFLTAEVFDSTLAKEIGLVHRICPEEQVEPESGKVIDELMKNGPNALRRAKALLNRIYLPNTRANLEACIREISAVRVTDEAQKGLAAFLEKKPAPWIMSAKK